MLKNSLKEVILVFASEMILRTLFILPLYIPSCHEALCSCLYASVRFAQLLHTWHAFIHGFNLLMACLLYVSGLAILLFYQVMIF